MPSIIPAVRKYLSDRRRAARCRQERRIVASVSLYESEKQSGSVLTGTAQDISEEGLSLILPRIILGGRLLGEGSHLLLIVLALPGGAIHLYGTAQYCDLLEQGNPEKGYQVGVRIKEINESCRRRLVEYLNTLK